jgi:hypothetical protein
MSGRIAKKMMMINAGRKPEMKLCKDRETVQHEGEHKPSQQDSIQ